MSYGFHSVVMGNIAAARTHLEQSVALYDPRHHYDYLLLCGQDEGIAAIVNLGWALWLLGYPDQALQRAEEGVLLAEELAHPISTAIAKHYIVHIRLLRGEAQSAHAQIDPLFELANEQGFGYVLGMVASYRGRAFLLEGKVEAAIEQSERVREEWRVVGNVLSEIFTTIDLAEAYGRRGEFEHGLSLLNEVPQMIEAISAHSGAGNSLPGEG